MPNRILRDGILTSEAVDKLGLEAEVFYRRLMSIVDDHGRHTANPSLLRAACYPLRLDAVRENDILGWLDEAEAAGLVARYKVAGKTYLEIKEFRQQMRSKSKCPDPICGTKEESLPSSCSADDEQMKSVAHLVVVGGVCEVEGVVVANALGASKAPRNGSPPPAAEIPTLPEVLAFCANCTPPVPPDFATHQFARHNEEHRWLTPQGRLLDWKARFQRYWSQDKPTWKSRTGKAATGRRTVDVNSADHNFL